MVERSLKFSFEYGAHIKLKKLYPLFVYMYLYLRIAFPFVLDIVKVFILAT